MFWSKKKTEDLDWFAYRYDMMVGPTVFFSNDRKWLLLVSLEIQGVEPLSNHPRCQLIVMMISRTAFHLPGWDVRGERGRGSSALHHWRGTIDENSVYCRATAGCFNAMIGRLLVCGSRPLGHCHRKVLRPSQMSQSRRS